MGSRIHRLFRFFFSFPPHPGRDPVLERIKLMAFYGLVAVIILSILILRFYFKTEAGTGVYFSVLFSAIALTALWWFRSTRIAGAIASVGMVCLMALTVSIGGGKTGFYLMHVLAFPVFLYFFLGLTPSLVISFLYIGAFLLTVSYYPFEAQSVFANPEFARRLASAAVTITLIQGMLVIAFELIVRHLSGIALVDLGTGLPNHRSLQDFIEEKIRAADGERTELTLVALRILDIPRLETIYGTAAVEAMTARIGQRIAASAGNAWIVGRWKANMFMAVFPSCEEGRIETLLKAGRTPKDKETQEIVPTLAAARCTYPGDASSAEALLSGIVAMLEVPTVEDGDILKPDRAWIGREAIKRSLIELVNHGNMDAEFTVRYQPKVRLRDRTCAGAEALLRWRPSEGNPIPPDIFIPLAEEADLISDITRWVIRRVFADHAAHAQEFGLGGVPPCSVNLSLHDLRDQTLMPTIEHVIAETGCRPEWIEFEITERLMVAEDARVKANLDELYAEGFGIFIDDFGTGYSSLSYLHRLKTHGLKLDRSFLPAPESGNVMDYPVVNAILSMSAALNLAVTAEGVETEEQAEYLSRRGCDLAQGWLFSRDLEFTDYIDFHLKWTPSGIIKEIR